MTTRNKWLWRLGLLIPIIWLIWAVFYPSRVVVHYDNPDKPINVFLDNEDGKVAQEHILTKGTAILNLHRYYAGWNSYFATLSWRHQNSNEKYNHIYFESAIGNGVNELDGVLNLNACRFDVYLDKEARLIKTEVKHPVFLYACW